MKKMNQTELTALANIGKTLAAKLQAIGINSREQLAEMTAPAAYRRLAAQAGEDRLPVCYNLYSLQGAFDGRDWREYSDGEKAALRDAASL